MVAMVRLMGVVASGSIPTVILTDTFLSDSVTRYSCCKNVMLTFTTDCARRRKGRRQAEFMAMGEQEGEAKRHTFETV